MRILGITSVSERRRIYIPKSVRELLGDSVSFSERGGRVAVERGGDRNIDERGRASIGRDILERLGVGEGGCLVFLGDGKDVYLARLENVDAKVARG